MNGNRLIVTIFALLSLLTVTGASSWIPLLQTATEYKVTLDRPLDYMGTYNGTLLVNGNPVTGKFDLMFALMSSISDDAGHASNIILNEVPVESGQFTVELDFTHAVMQRSPRYLQIRVRPSVNGAFFTDIIPLFEVATHLQAQSLPGLWGQWRADSPNLIGGYYNNSVKPGVRGATIGGGGDTEGLQVVAENYGTISGGRGNYASGYASTINGGQWNLAAGASSVVGGGGRNKAHGINNTIGGGEANTARGDNSTIAGGKNNIAGGGNTSTVGGGGNNEALADFSTIGGGSKNSASGLYATIPGGSMNTANGSNSFAAGTMAGAEHMGTFVWSDATGTEFSSTNRNQFLIRASGGVGIGTNAPQGALDVVGRTIVEGEIKVESPSNVTNVEIFPTLARPAGAILVNDEGQERIAIIGRNLGADSNGGLIQFKNSNGKVTIEILGDEQGNNAGWMSLNDDGERRIYMTATTGQIQIKNGSGNATVDILGDNNNGAAWMSLNDNGEQKISMAARSPAYGVGGIIDIRNGQGQPTVQIIGDTGEGFGRVKTSVLEITGGSDLAELFEVDGIDTIEPGMVVSIDPNNPGKLRVTDRAYDRTVAGVISGAGSLNTGLILQQKDTIGAGEYPIALTGRVYVWADASNGAIQPGDLLTTADTSGHAMKVSGYERAQGAILGKAMTSLESGRGLILVLVTLQ